MALTLYGLTEPTPLYPLAFDSGFEPNASERPIQGVFQTLKSCRTAAPDNARNACEVPPGVQCG